MSKSIESIVNKMLNKIYSIPQFHNSTWKYCISEQNATSNYAIIKSDVSRQFQNF